MIRSRLFLTRGGAPLSDYTTGLTKWYQPSTVANADNTDLTSWTDSGSAAANATGAGGTVPKWRTAILNGLGGAQFIAASTLKLTFTTLSLTGDFAIQIVQSSSGDSDLLGAGSGNQQVRIGDSGNNRLSLYAGGADNPQGSTLSTPHDDAHFSIIEYRRSGTAVSFFENGVAVGTGTLSSGGADTLSLGSIGVDAFSGGVGYATAHMCEVRVWNSAQTAANLKTARLFLGQKYGISTV